MKKKSALILSFLIYATICLGQQLKTAKQFVFSGKISEYSGTSIVISFEDENFQFKQYEIPVENGSFKFISNVFKKPQVVSLNGENFPLRSLLVAPGYNVRLTANGKNELSFLKTLKMEGRGSIANRFYFSLDTINLPTCYNDSSESEFVEFYKNDNLIIESSYKRCTKQYVDKNDKYFPFFKKVVFNDISFAKLKTLSYYLVKHIDNYTSLEAEDFLEKNFDKKIINDISNPQFLNSPVYKECMGSFFYYLFYLIKLQKKKNPDFEYNYKNALNQIDKTYTGKVKDYVLLHFIALNLITATASYEKFIDGSEITMPYIQKINNKITRAKLFNDVKKQEDILIKDKVGQPAPIFNSEDADHRKYSLNDFKNKVIMLDFWASWCAPCRHETPVIKALYNKYKNDSNIVFISIAVRDKMEAWTKAIQQDSPLWLQLFDSDNSVASSYVTNAIPKFVIIDKKGNIVDFQAPMPSEGNKLEDILEKELKK